MLRIDSNILWTIINLLILYVLLRKFLFGRVHKIMDERAAQLQKIHADADADRQEAESSGNRTMTFSGRRMRSWQ